MPATDPEAVPGLADALKASLESLRRPHDPPADPETVPGLFSAIHDALRDPGKYAERQRILAAGYVEPQPQHEARAVLAAVEPFLSKPAKHDPAVNCNCESGADPRCEYRFLADAVIDAFNPADGDEAEVAICVAAVRQARDALKAIPCSCTPEMIEDWDQCARCAALGQRGGKAVQR